MNGRRTRYAEAAIGKELATLRRAQPGGRARAAFKAAAAIGNFVAAGAIELESARLLLLDAAVATGLPTPEARESVRRGLARGMKSPREAAGGTWRKDEARSRGVDREGGGAYPPAEEVAALWAACMSATDDEEAAKWLPSRAIDPVAVELWDLARVVPRDGILLPRWAASRGGMWAATGHRLLVPLYDADGRFASFRARAMRDAQPKELAPQGCSARGLVMADALGRGLLAGDVPDWWTRLVVFQEGVPDFLTRAGRQSDSCEQGPAVFGIFAGSWTQEIAERMPRGARVVLRTHHDEAGDGYASAIAKSLGDRVELLRSRAQP